VYATAHVRNVDRWDELEDGRTLVDIDAGFVVAPGDTSDIEVANAHPWGSDVLVFSDGAQADTLIYIFDHRSNKGMSCSVCELDEILH
jgi:hypothetical protein